MQFTLAQHPSIQVHPRPEVEWWRLWVEDGVTDADVFEPRPDRDVSVDELWDRLGDFA
jgi:hypothetical protein